MLPAAPAGDIVIFTTATNSAVTFNEKWRRIMKQSSTHSFIIRLDHLPLLIVAFLLSISNAVHGFTASNCRVTHHNIKMSIQAEDSTTLQPIRAGFVGCGTIAYSIASGLANPDHSVFLSQKSLALDSIYVTRRSESRSSQLKQSYPDTVTVCETAEEVVKNSEIVFLCVLPQHVDEVLAGLKEKGVWNEGAHTLVSLVVSRFHISYYL